MADRKTRITVNPPRLDTFKGNPTLVLNPDERVGVAFGLGKGMVIVENLAAICAFLKSDGKSLELDQATRAEVDAFAARFLPKQG